MQQQFQQNSLFQVHYNLNLNFHFNISFDSALTLNFVIHFIKMIPLFLTMAHEIKLLSLTASDDITLLTFTRIVPVYKSLFFTLDKCSLPIYVISSVTNPPAGYIYFKNFSWIIKTPYSGYLTPYSLCSLSSNSTVQSLLDNLTAVQLSWSPEVH